MAEYRLFQYRWDEAGASWMPVAACFAAVGIFLVDAFTRIDGAVAGLYVVPMLLLAEVLTRQGILAATLTFVAAGIIAFLISHGSDYDFPTILRLGVSLAAIGITYALLCRNHHARLQLLSANAALRESEARYRSIFDNTRVALWERDYSALYRRVMALKAGGVTDIRKHALAHPEFVRECLKLVGTTSANSAATELLGPSSGKSRPGYFDRFFLPDDASFLSTIEAIFDDRRFLEMEATMMSDTSERRRVLLSISVPEGASSYDRVVVSMTDLTHRNQAQKALEEAKADLTLASRATMVGTLTASLAHELNQPLGAIVVNSKTLMRWLDKDPPDLPSAYRAAERMERDSRRASDIIKNTREHLTQGRRLYEQANLDDLLRDTLTILEQDLERQDVAVKVTAAPGLPEVRVVRIEIQQILINLIGNAVQAMDGRPDASIWINLGIAHANEVYIVIRDNGPGLPDHMLTTLATPFFTTKETGMGLGLSICQSLIEAHGGSLSAYNNPEGGARFEMTLQVEPSDG